MHSFSISQPIDGTCSLLLLPETKSVVLICLGIAGMQLNSRPSLRVVYLNTEWLFHEALLGLNFKTCCFAR